ncbi:MAG: DUF2264 domain-containing protein [Lachnospiraceae bacterium]|nr:DUF2264 domain-containing protein [Lachnospiraceae bacterium]
MNFKSKSLDHTLSPYTGLTRDSWIEAGIYILEGVFNNIKDFEDPVVLPRTETQVTYPHLNDTPENLRQQQLAEIFEGLTRTFFIAAPLIHERPELTINGINLRDYYSHHILRVIDPKDEYFVGSYESLTRLTGSDDPTRCYQQTVETCALVIGLWLAEKEIWEAYCANEKDRIAEFLNGFACAPTVPQNWRFFNMLDLAFLNMHGYSIDHDIMTDHAQAVLAYYAGDGWYRDGQCFDYYSCWAFSLYAPIWNLWYGYDNLPYIAARFEANSNSLMDNYPRFFDKDGFTDMWGRSCIYRFAATSAFDGNLLLHKSAVKPGLARRIASGSLLQFITRDDFLSDKGVPNLGFYGQFTPLVQGYSCAESPYWFGKAFLCLHFPADHPFWTEKEENGIWDELAENAVKETSLSGPGILVSNHAGNGETILRTSKIRKDKSDIHGMWNYGKLSYNSKFPWEATPLAAAEVFGPGEVESEQYTIKDITTGRILYPNVNLYCGYRDAVLYRRFFFDFDMSTENHWNQAVNAADIAMSLGILRVDKLRLYRKPVSITLGSYGFPDNDTVVTEVSKDGQKAIILKGHDHTGAKISLAMTVIAGFDDLHITKSRETNPDSRDSIVLFAYSKQMNLYDAKEPYIMISQVITRTDDKDFTEDELFPVKKITYEDHDSTGAYGPITIELKSGRSVTVDYAGMEGNMSL